MNETTVSRFGCIVFSLFPALWGLFSLLNNVADFTGTVNNVVSPLLAMQNTFQTPGLMWRAITADWAGIVGLSVITAIEAIAGMLATVGAIIMLLRFKSPYAIFSRGKSFAMAGAICAISVWGLGFMVIAGDWFMAWQSEKNPLGVQLGALIYMVPNALALLFLSLHRETS